MLKSGTLRRSTAHVLAGNLALGDFLLSVYITTLTLTRQIVSFETFFIIQRTFCRIVGISFMIGQFISPVMTLTMTLERYLVIVHCMHTGRRLTLTHVYIIMVVGWTLAITISICFTFVGKMSVTATGTDDVCILLMNENGENLLYIPLAFLWLCHFTSVILYLHIYFDVKRTRQRTEQLRQDKSIAKKIALITGTNILFALVPVLIILILANTFVGNYLNDTTKNIFWDCFGITCMITNSCLNPLLFSFRNSLFRTELCKLIGCYSNEIHVAATCKGKRSVNTNHKIKPF